MVSIFYTLEAIFWSDTLTSRNSNLSSMGEEPTSYYYDCRERSLPYYPPPPIEQLGGREGLMRMCKNLHPCTKCRSNLYNATYNRRKALDELKNHMDVCSLQIRLAQSHRQTYRECHKLHALSGFDFYSTDMHLTLNHAEAAEQDYLQDLALHSLRMKELSDLYINAVSKEIAAQQDASLCMANRLYKSFSELRPLG